MKNFIYLILSVTFLISCDQVNNNLTANSNANFKVWGNCDMCKGTIETSLKTEGISKADWNTETKMITVSFDSTKITLDKIQKNIAAVGYDNDGYKGDDKAYSELHGCCQYERKP